MGVLLGETTFCGVTYPLEGRREVGAINEERDMKKMTKYKGDREIVHDLIS